MTRKTSVSSASGAHNSTVQDFLNPKEELRSRIADLIPEIVKSAYFYVSIQVADVLPSLSDSDIFVVPKTKCGCSPQE